MSTKNCCIQLDRKRDKLEQVLWLHDVYVQPIYAPDEGPPKALKNYIKSWTEFLTISSMAICWFIFFVTYLVDFADDKSFHWFSVQIVRTRLRTTNSFNDYNTSFVQDLLSDSMINAAINDAALFDEETTTTVISRTTLTPTTTTQKAQPRVQGISHFLGLWKRCFRRCEDQLECSRPADSWSNKICQNWDLPAATKSFNFEDDFIFPVFTEIRMARVAIGIGIGLILCSVCCLPLGCIHRNSIFNISATIALLGNLMIFMTSTSVLYLPFQTKMETYIEWRTESGNGEETYNLDFDIDIDWPPKLNMIISAFLGAIILIFLCRTHHFPLPYTDRNVARINDIISQFRSNTRTVQEKYTKRRAEERKTAEATLESLEHNLADTIEKASQQYLDIVGSERFTLDTYDRKSQVNPISSNPMGVNTKISNRTMKNINEFNKRLSATQISTLEGRIDEISETSSQVSSIPRQSGRDSGRRSST